MRRIVGPRQVLQAYQLVVRWYDYVELTLDLLIAFLVKLVNHLVFRFEVLDAVQQRVRDFHVFSIGFIVVANLAVVKRSFHLSDLLDEFARFFCELMFFTEQSH